MAKASSKKKIHSVKSVITNILPMEVYLSASSIYGALKVAHSNDYVEHRPSDDELQKLALLHAQTLYKIYIGEK